MVSLALDGSGIYYTLSFNYQLSVALAALLIQEVGMLFFFRHSVAFS